MTEEKKDGIQHQNDFLSGHEELLNSIKKTDDPAVEAEETPTEEPIIEPIEEEVAPEAIAEEPIVEPEIAPEPVTADEPAVEEEPAPEPIAEEEPVVEAESSVEPEPHIEAPKKTAPAKPAVAKKKKTTPTPEKHPERSQADKQRHEALLKHQALEKSEVKEVLNFIQKYAKPASIAMITVCALVIVNSVLKTNRLNKAAKADTALSQAQSAEDFQAILDDFGSTPSAPLALMGLAQHKFNAGQVDEANALYGQFIKKYQDHELTAQAVFNQITCKEAKGQFGDAHLLYGEFANTHKNSHLAPVALLGKARCLEAAALFAEAKQVYEDLVTFYPESGWAQIAESNLKVVESKLK